MNTEASVEIVLRQIAEDLGLETNGNVDDLLDRIIRNGPEMTSANEEVFLDILRQLNAYDSFDQPTKSDDAAETASAKVQSAPDKANLDISRLIKMMRREILMVTREVQLMRDEFRLFRVSTDLMYKRQRLSAPKVNMAMISDLLENFTGADCNYDEWERRLKMLCVVYDLNGEATRLLIQSRLRGDAGAWFISLPYSMQININDLLEKMRNKYGRRRDESEPSLANST